MSEGGLLSSSRSQTAPLQRYLRWLQVTLYAGSCIFAMISCVTLKVTFEDLKDTCPLYAKPSKVELAPSENGTYFIKLEGDLKGGEKKTCYYSMYLNVATASYSLAWGALFALLSSPDKARKGHLRRLVFPSLLFNSVLFTSQLISSCVLTLGHRHWCNTIIEDLQATDHVKQLMSRSQFHLTCALIQSFPWKALHEDYAYFRSSKFFGLITIAQISSWMVSLTMLVLSIICGERFFKAVWFGEFEGNGSQNSDISNIQDLGFDRRKPAASAATATAGLKSQETADVGVRSNRSASPPRLAATGAVPSSPLQSPPNGTVCESQSPSAAAQSASHRKALALVSSPGMDSTCTSSTSAAAAAGLELGNNCDTLLENRSALAGYERSMVGRQKSNQSARSGTSLASSATPLLILETPQSPQLPQQHQLVLSTSPGDGGIQETPLWEPREPLHRHGSLRQSARDRARQQQQQQQCKHCNLYTAWRTQY